MKTTCLTIDDNTKKLIDEFGKKHSLSRSATIRLIINEFFLKQETE